LLDFKQSGGCPKQIGGPWCRLLKRQVKSVRESEDPMQLTNGKNDMLLWDKKLSKHL